MRTLGTAAGEEPHSPQLEKTLQGNEDLAQPKLKKERTLKKVCLKNKYLFPTFKARNLQWAQGEEDGQAPMGRSETRVPPPLQQGPVLLHCPGSNGTDHAVGVGAPFSEAGEE